MSETSAPHAQPVEAIVQSLGTDAERGLTDARAEEQRARYGVNELAEAPPIPAWKKFLGQFKALVIWILIVAAVISAILGEKADALAIMAIVLLNGILGFVQEEKAERSLAALQKLSAPLAKVTRNGEPRTVAARELVPGDRIEIDAGDNVPADARLVEAFNFRVQEASLTGESTSVEKHPGDVLPATTPLADRRNMAYMGTVAATGRAIAIVVATGMQTQLGHIAGMLQRHEAEPTPLQKRLAELGRVLVVGCLALVALVFGIELLRGGDLLGVFLMSVSLAVAAVPEGLPAVVTVALALGLQRMVKRNAIVRKLPSVETLGSVTVICSDKTGTLTRNEMTVRELAIGGAHYRVTGAGYTSAGDYLKRRDTDTFERADAHTEPDLMLALTIGSQCNNAHVRPRADGKVGWEVIGDPTEGALIIAGYKTGISAREKRVYEISFDSERKAMSVILSRDGGHVMYTKGAPEVILSKCVSERRDGKVEPLTDARRNEILAMNTQMASRALRVLGLAYREQPDKDDSGGFVETGLVFAGLVGMIDPPREEAKEAVKKCRDAGIRPVMITGDHPATARAIARELDIATEAERVITGQELDGLSDAELDAAVDRIAVYARVSAEHKLRVVRAWKRRGQVVAMTGDGVNDGPAIKAADIGIAMGISGMDVTKEASAMVLADDNFASIVNAVEEGRGIFDNIQKVLAYLLSSNAGEILFVLVVSVLGWPAPLLPLQLLWINLVTDGLPALALSREPPEPDVMQRKPQLPGTKMLSGRMALTLLLHGVLIGGTALAAFAIHYGPHPRMLARARTMAFCVLVFGELFRSLSARSSRLTLARLGLFSNPYLLGAIGVSALLQLSVVTLPFTQPLFESATHYTWEWIDVFVLALIPACTIELAKWVYARWEARRDAGPARRVTIRRERRVPRAQRWTRGRRPSRSPRRGR